MKKGILIAALILSVALGMTVLAGCSKEWEKYTYEESAKYVLCEGTQTAENITELDIGWVGGKITVVEDDVDKITFSEEINSDDADLRMRYYADGEVLRIRYSANKIKLSIFNKVTKKLTIKVPRNTTLKNFEIDAVSADQNITDITTESFAVNSVSGNVKITNLSVTGDMKINTVSGDITFNDSTIGGSVKIDAVSGDIKGTGEIAKGLNIKTVSGDMNISGKIAGEIKVKTTSGDMDISGKIAGEIKVKTTSGNCDFTTTESIQSFNGETVSGDFKVVLPETATGFTAKLTTTSGDFNSNKVLSKNGKEYVCGDGSTVLEVKTVSGDLTVNIG